jgi:DNA-binding transcriptional MerR regulator
MGNETNYTSGELAKLLDLSAPRLRYLLERERIEPVLRVGTWRLFDTAAADRLRTVLDRKARGRN